MLKVNTFVLGQLATNCYLLSHQDNCILIDPADDADFLSTYIYQNNLQLKAILLTHGHYDHCLATFELQTIFNSPVYVSYKDNFLLDQIANRASYWQSNKSTPYFTPKLTHDLNQFQQLHFLSQTFQIINTPGHTPGSVCFYLAKQNILFSGDTLFKNAIGRTDLSYSLPDQIKSSLTKLFQLPDCTVVYPGHGPHTTLKKEQVN